MFNKEARRLARGGGTWTDGVDAGAIGAACTMATLRDMLVCLGIFHARERHWYLAWSGEGLSVAQLMTNAVGLF